MLKTLFTLILFLLFSCNSNSFRETVFITVGPLPPQLIRLSQTFPCHWILIRGGEEKILPIGEVPALLSLEFLRGISEPVILKYILVRDDGFSFSLYSGGLIYPLEREAFQLDLSYLAQVLMEVRVYRSINSINLFRLIQVVEEKSGGDSSLIDRNILYSSLVRGDISFYKIRKRRIRSVVLEIPLGTWFSEGDSCRFFFSKGGEMAINLPQGIHRFIDDQGRILEISVGYDGSWESLIY